MRPTPAPAVTQVQPGDVVSARMPTDEERERLGLPEGVPLLAVRRADGQEEIYDANGTRLQVLPAGNS